MAMSIKLNLDNIENVFQLPPLEFCRVTGIDYTKPVWEVAAQAARFVAALRVKHQAYEEKKIKVKATILSREVSTRTSLYRSGAASF